MNDAPLVRNRNFSALLVGVFLILLTGGFQLAGYCWPLEQRFLKALPSGLLPASFSHSPVVLLELNAGSDGFAAMDIALALRGLSLLHPDRVLLDGRIAEEKEAIPLLPGVLDRLKKDPSMVLVLPHAGGVQSVFQPIPLTRCPPCTNLFPWQKVQGKALAPVHDPVEGAYLPAPQEKDQDLPLLAMTDDGSVIGSLWWWALPSEVTASPSYLFFGKIFLSSTATFFWITPSGAYHPLSDLRVKPLSLDDFLLRVEQKEQGTISPGFDALWNKAVVIIGTSAEEGRATALADLLRATGIRPLSFVSQTVITFGWVLLFLLIQELHLRASFRFTRWIFPPVILIALIGITLCLLPHGILLPFLPGLIVALAVCF
jgi:hypothetical protein